jgi:hypothetical protein
LTQQAAATSSVTPSRPRYVLTNFPAPLPPKSSQKALQDHVLALQNYTNAARGQIEADHAAKKLMDEENEKLRSQLFAKKNKPAKLWVGGSGSQHMTNDENLDALAETDWHVMMGKVLKEASEQFGGIKARQKALDDAEKKAEADAEREGKKAQFDAEKLRKKAEVGLERLRKKAEADVMKVRKKIDAEAEKQCKKAAADLEKARKKAEKEAEKAAVHLTKFTNPPVKQKQKRSTANNVDENANENIVSNSEIANKRPQPIPRPLIQPILGPLNDPTGSSVAFGQPDRERIEERMSLTNKVMDDPNIDPELQ